MPMVRVGRATAAAFMKSTSIRWRGSWSLLPSWLRPHRGVAQEKLPLYLAFFQFVHKPKKRGKARQTTLVEAIVTPKPGMSHPLYYFRFLGIDVLRRDP